MTTDLVDDDVGTPTLDGPRPARCASATPAGAVRPGPIDRAAPVYAPDASPERLDVRRSVVVPVRNEAENVEPLARKLGELEAAGRPLAHFAGRLDAPIVELATNGELERWLAEHPDGAIVLYFWPPHDPAPLGPLLVHPYRGRGPPRSP